jgi:hypothetical protein
MEVAERTSGLDRYPVAAGDAVPARSARRQRSSAACETGF